MAGPNPWAALTPYAAGDTVTYQGAVYTALKAFTSGASFSRTNWQMVLSPILWRPTTGYRQGDLASWRGAIFRALQTFTSGATFDPTAWEQLTPSSLFGIVSTAPPFVVCGPLNIGSANDCRYMRVLSGGDIVSVRLHVAASSGNIAVAAYRNSGEGRSAVPGVRLATSGAIACPAIGDVDIALGATIRLYEGDWLALSADNATATFTVVSGSSGTTSLMAGLAYQQTSAHPCPTTPSSLIAQNNRLVVLGGV